MPKCWGPRAWGRRLKLVVAGLLVGLVLVLGMPAVYGQFPIPGAESPNAVPYNVRRSGLLEVTDIDLDGRTLFEIASPTVTNRGDPGTQVPVEVRAEQIETNLQQLVVPKAGQSASLPADLDVDSLEVYVETVNNQPVIWARHNRVAAPRALLTVTDADAQYYSMTKLELAEEWRGMLQASLKNALERRQPAAQMRQRTISAGLVVSTLLLTLLFIGLWAWLGRRQKRLEEQREAQETAQRQGRPQLSEGSYEPDWLDWFEGLRRLTGLQRRIQLVYFLRWLLFWGTAFIWLAAVAGVLYQFPRTRQLAVGLVSTPTLALLAWFLAGLTNRLADLSIDRFAKAWQMNEAVPIEAFQRRTLRISTITTVVKGFKGVLIYAIALLLVLQILEVAPVSVLALGAILALAASLAAQNLVKDVVNGFLILLEDQYAIGDYVGINGVTGIVENLNLRITQIRSNAGNLITIPNSQILQSENMSRQWARCDYTVEVAYDTDVDKAIAIVHEVAETLAKDSDWGKLILNPAEILGVDHISHSGIQIRIWIRTLPLQQWALAREFRRRLKIAFDRQGIHIGIPQQSLSGSLTGQLTPESLN